jgi:hypothetical protein
MRRTAYFTVGAVKASGRPLNFTVGHALDSPVPTLSPVARTFVTLNRVFGAFVVVGALCLLAKVGWHLLLGTRDWSQSYFALLFGISMVVVGIVYLRAPWWRRPREAAGGDSSQDH